MVSDNHFALVLLMLIGIFFTPASAQDIGQTGRKTVHRRQVTQTASAAQTDLSTAESSIEKKDFVAALALLEKVVAATPDDFQAWFDLGFVKNALGNIDESIAAYRKSVKLKPDVFESNLNLGLMLQKSGLPDAEEYLRAATRLKPTAHADEGLERAWLALGRLFETSKPGDAIEAYRKAEALQPKDPEPRLSAGQLLEKQNQFADAEQEYRTILANDPTSADALTGLANIYTRGQRFAEAEELLQALVRLHPSDVAARTQLGRLLFLAGKNDAAISEFQEAIKQNPQNFEVQRNLAALYLAQNKLEDAVPLYRSLLAKAPADAELHNSLGETFLKQRNFLEAQREFLLAIKIKSDFGVAYGNLAVAASENKDYPLAIKAVDARARFLPEIPVSFFLRASAYDHLRDYKQATQNYRRFLEVADGKYPDQEWQARHRLIAIERKK